MVSVERNEILGSLKPFAKTTKKQHPSLGVVFNSFTTIMLIYDPYGIRTRVTAVKGRCLNRLTNGPNLNLVAAEGVEPTTSRV